MYWIVSYDVVSDKRRRKVCQILEGYGRRAQYSVFECEMEDDQCEQLHKRLKKAIDPQEDDVRFYPLNRADLKRVRLLGLAELHQPRRWYLV